MSWNLFLDDIRDPSYINSDKIFVIARSFDEAVSLILEHGCPSFISFDHDLGWDQLKPGDHVLITELPKDEKSGYDLVKWMIEADLDDTIKIPENFSFSVHSANPVGAENIRNLLSNYIKHKL